ncbi:efflux transporter outer membrane subunit [Hahella sp. CCB-MM4]|uniref:efflux transporter outer membrane subunit n=1 Tax=Hahella sp. (strain CCB-MM4) TaxID=1926491 RepID=UPI001FF00EE9|nr:efflux transporter outer membrane subunit [Hahella sp. CCB-MM4]
MNRGRLHLICLAFAGLTLTGCAGLTTTDRSNSAAEAQQAITAWEYDQVDATNVAQLDDLVGIPELDELLSNAFENNPGLRQTALALAITRRQYDATSGSQLPSLTATLSDTRQDSPEDVFSAGLSVSWELDLWRKLADNTEAAAMDIAASEATLQSARDSLAASLMRSWLQISQYQQLLTIETDRLKTLERNQQLVTQRYRSGLGDLEELDNARTSSASTRATIADYEEKLAQSVRNLKQQLGILSADSVNDVTSVIDSLLSSTSTAFPEVLQPLSAIPEQDLARRPDLQEAYANILAAQYRSKVAYKDLLPSITLTGSLTNSGNSLNDVLTGSPAWNLLGQLTAPLFQGGQLRAAADIAELKAEQAFWGYQETLISAVKEVNDTLGQEQSLERQQQHIREALKNAQRSADHYQSKYRQGLVDILDLLSVQQQTFDLQAQLIQITYNRLANRVDLGLALGLGVTS